MSLLIDKEFTFRATELCRRSKDTIVIFSAFLKQGALEYISESIPQSISVCIVSRWQKHDLICGASDLKVYEICRDRGWKFGISLNLHGKLFLFDDTQILLGSANLTNKGLGLYGQGNVEFGTEIYANDVDLNKISNLSNEITWIDDSLYESISVNVGDTCSQKLENASWPKNLLNKLLKPVEYFWAIELPFSKPQDLICLNLDDESVAHDFELLQLDIDEINKTSIKRQFKKTRVYMWLLMQLEDHEEMNFGALSSALHNALLDNPKPYRRNVKEFLAIIFVWIEFLNEDFNVTKYERTKSVRLRS